MIRTSTALRGLFVGTALSTAFIAGAAMAQAQDQPAAGQQTGANSDLLSDITVTATRQVDTVNRVPLSITAVTQRSLDQQGIKNVADLQRTVPALNVSGQSGGVANYSIRGIIATSGAATTGLYLDDTPLQKRNSNGVAQNNGTPAPPLFDLERVEVLRGPQGTLYGGSSQGGTIRFITPTPSLTRYSGYGRAEISQVKSGGTSYEGGIAIGGPIVQDKLGFRASLYDRTQAGYVDMVDVYNNGRIIDKDANSRHDRSARVALLWAPTDRLRVTGQFYKSIQRDEGGPEAYNLPVNGTYTTAEYCFDTRRTVSTNPAATTPVACPANAVPFQTVNGIYKRGALTYGPYPFLGKYKSIVRDKSPARTTADVTNLTLDYDFSTMTVKSITSYIHDQTNATSLELPQVSNQQRLEGIPASQANRNNFAIGFPLFSPWPDYQGYFVTYNKRKGIIEELRFASSPNATPLSWVGGVYYSNIASTSDYKAFEDGERQTQLLFGLTNAQRYSQQNPDGTRTGLVEIPGKIITARVQHLKDIEIAAFGEANYQLTEKLRATAGVRISRVTFDYDQTFYGPASGWNTPTVANTGVVAGSVNESPVTPKFGLQYQISENDQVYVTAAKGFRPGGVNSPISESICGVGLANVGLTVRDIPVTFGSDTVWSYEAGAKVRVFNNRLAFNASVYRIDWTGVQLNVSIPGCGQTYAQNAGQARSQGFDIQTQARLFKGFTATLAAGYTDAKYVQTALGPKPLVGTATPIVREGDTFPIPPWQVSLSGQYDFQVGAKYDAYIRADYQWQNGFYRGPGPGVNAFSPDTRDAEARNLVNMRFGVNFNGWDANVFVNNVLQSDDELTRGGGRGTCPVAEGAACTTYGSFNPFVTVSNYRPREFGLQVSKRF